MAMCGVMATTSARKCVWMRNQSQEWWDCDGTSFPEEDFIQNPRTSGQTVTLITSVTTSPQDSHPKTLISGDQSLWHGRRMKCDLTVHAVVTLGKHQIRIWSRTINESDTGLMWREKNQISCHLSCSDHHKKNQIWVINKDLVWVTFGCSVNISRVLKQQSKLSSGSKP